MELKELIGNVQQWSKDRGLDKADSRKQLLKLYEEFGELVQGHLKGNIEQVKDSIGDMLVVEIIYCQQRGIEFDSLFTEQQYSPSGLTTLLCNIAIAIGDLSGNIGPRTSKRNILEINQYLQVISSRYGTTLEACLGMAWNEIKDRKGKMIDGVFVKKEDLK